MIYHGKEKENHRGSHVKYFHCNKWHEGTLLEPVNYQIVVTKENPPAILSTHSPSKPSNEDVEKAKAAVDDGTFTDEDLKVLSMHLGNYGSMTEVDSVEITEANDITQEEADKIIEAYRKRLQENVSGENGPNPANPSEIV